MTVVGIILNKIEVEKKEAEIRGKLSLNNNIAIKNVENKDLSLGKNKQAGLRFNFKYTSAYEPNLAAINLEGDVFYLDSEEKLKEIKESWEKDKKIPVEVTEQVLNAALTKSTVEAIKLSQDVGLPTPIPLPKLKTTVKTQKPTAK